MCVQQWLRRNGDLMDQKIDTAATRDQVFIEFGVARQKDGAAGKINAVPRPSTPWPPSQPRRYRQAESVGQAAPFHRHTCQLSILWLANYPAADAAARLRYAIRKLRRRASQTF
jgi:hypothetical protein